MKLLFIFFLSLTLTDLYSQDSLIQNIPGTNFSFKMKLLPGGEFKVGDKTNVQLDPIYFSIHEVTFDEFNCFRERDQDNDESANAALPYKADAVTRPTPQYVNLTSPVAHTKG